MKLSLFDLHCDTAGEMLRQCQSLADNTLAVSLKKAKVFSQYIQVMAHWTPYSLSDEDGWECFLRMNKNLTQDPALTNGDAILCANFPSELKKPSLLLAVEDVRIVAGKMERIDQLHQMGVSIVTPMWRGSTCIGGSHDVDEGLTPFGRQAVKHMLSLGMIPDISHASVQSAKEIFEIAKAQGRPVIASHSNAYEICSVSRNLQKEQIKELLEVDGLIGLNLYKAFLKTDGEATAADVFPHIDYLLDMGCENHLALGCDMDGCDLPPDVPDLAALPYLAELMLARGYSEALIQKIFFDNAYSFAKKYLS